MKYLILGAGPAGLTLGNMFKRKGETSFLIIEKQHEAGGLCRSTEVDGAPFDIGGGHFLDVKNVIVTDFLFSFMAKSEWNKFERNSKIMLKDILINSPFEANIWQMPLEGQVKYLKNIAVAGCNLGEAMPEKFVDWIYWKLGSEIADNYMIPYNQKMFADDLKDLGTYWLDKLPNVSFEETLLSCLNRQAYGKQPGHSSFYYPKNYGYGELWLRMADSIKENIVYNNCINKIDFENKIVESTDGEIYQADIIINTIPWREFKIIKGMPEKLKNSINELKYSSIETKYFDENIRTDAQWIYYPNADLEYHRILLRYNFCPNSKGYWTETRKERINLNQNAAENHFCYMNEYAYPINTIHKPEIMKKLLLWTANQGVYGLGRWGEHQHFNSDATVELALKMAEKLLS